MTPREKEIFDLIQQQPLISQSEIADQLNIARSSVAVYIASMIKQGIIQGRGYILGFNSELTPYVCVIGTVAADFIGEIDKMPNPDIVNLYESTLMYQRYGGIAKNTAEILSSLDLKPKLIAALGKDIWGQACLQECQQHNISTEGCIDVDGSATDIYWEIRYKQPQRILLRLANCKLRSFLTPEVLLSRRHLIAQAKSIVVEDGLPIESLQYLLDSVDRKKLFLETTDPADRRKQVRHLLPAFGNIIASCEYLCQIYETIPLPEKYSIDEVTNIARLLLEEGFGSCLFTFGPQYLCYLHHKRLYISSARFNDGEENPIYQRFQLCRACITGTFVHCQISGDTPEVMLRKIAIARHHAALSGNIVPCDFSLSTISKYYSKMDDQLQVVSLQS